MITKTALAFQFLDAGDTTAALRVIGTFKRGLTIEQQRTVKTGYECLVHRGFYTQLKIDPDKAVAAALEVCNQLRPAPAR